MKPRGFEFEEVLVVDPSKSWFDMSYKNKFTANFGKLYPFYLEETMPGDRFKINSTVFARLQPLLAPTMQQCDIFSYFFYVPNRLVWDNWKKFQSKGDGSVKMKDAASYVPPVHPYVVPSFCLINQVNDDSTVGWHIEVHTNDADWTLVKTNVGTFSIEDYNKYLSIFDFMGVPFNCTQLDAYGNPILFRTTKGVGNSYTVLENYSSFGLPAGTTFDLVSGVIGNISLSGVDAGVNYKINCLPFFAYNNIFNEFFRSQDYMDEVSDKASDGAQLRSSGFEGSFKLLSKCFEHDYFTSILPDCQRGPDVSLSLAGSAPLKLFGQENTMALSTDGVSIGTGALRTGVNAIDPTYVPVGVTNTQYTTANTQIDITPHTKVDLTGVSAITINALRYANTLQKYEEALARSGSRYNEMLLAIFGVQSSDASIQRPIFLGASRTPISINDVAQTSSTTGSDALGQLAGRGIAVGDVNTDFYCEENGWIIGMLAIVPRTQYFQGLSRHLLKTVDLDYPIPMFAHLGEQETYKSELYYGCDSHDGETLGYLPRYSEYKYHSDEIHAELKSSLNFWTMSRKVAPGTYGAQIDSDFLKADTMNYDAFAVTDSSVDHFILDVTNSVALQRSLPEYSTPLL